MKLKTWTLWIPLLALVFGVLLPLEVAAVVAPRAGGEGLKQEQQIDPVLDKKEQRKLRRAQRRADRKAYREARKGLLVVGMAGLMIWPLGIGLSALGFSMPLLLVGIGVLVGFHCLMTYLISNKNARIAFFICFYILAGLVGLGYAVLDALSSLTFF